MPNSIESKLILTHIQDLCSKHISAFPTVYVTHLADQLKMDKSAVRTRLDILAANALISFADPVKESFVLTHIGKHGKKD